MDGVYTLIILKQWKNPYDSMINYKYESYFQHDNYWLLARLIYIVLIQKKELDIGNVALKCFFLVNVCCRKR